ncbi:MAG: hypothetical protein WKG00_19610 [Polyangiaceae bacterium]
MEGDELDGAARREVLGQPLLQLGDEPRLVADQLPVIVRLGDELRGEHGAAVGSGVGDAARARPPEDERELAAELDAVAGVRADDARHEADVAVATE